MGVNYSNQVFVPPVPSTISQPFEILENSQMKIPIFFSEWKGRNGAKAYYTLLYSYGCTEDLSQNIEWLTTLRDVLHVNVIGYEYAGYGQRHDLVPSEQECYNDISFIYHYLVNVKNIPSERILLMGKDIGTGVSIDLACSLYQQIQKTMKRRSNSRSTSRKRASTNVTAELFQGFAGLILLNPMTSILGLRSELKGLYPDMFQNVNKIADIKCPTFFIHSTACVIDTKHSVKLSKLMEEWKWKVEIVEQDLRSDQMAENDHICDNLLEFVDYLSPKQVKEEASKRSSFVPEQFRNSPHQIMEEWLKQLELEEYLETFLSAGFFDPSSLQSLNEMDLDLLQIENPDHRARLLNPASYSSQPIMITSSSDPIPSHPPKKSTNPSPKVPKRRMSNLLKKPVNLPGQCHHGVEDECKYCLCEKDPNYIPPAPTFAVRCTKEQYSNEMNITQQRLAELYDYMKEKNIVLGGAPKEEKKSRPVIPKIFNSNTSKKPKSNKENFDANT